MSLESYAVEYLRAFNEYLPTLPPSPYATELIEARVFHARNAAVIFFLPKATRDISPNFLPQGRGEFLPLKEGGVSISPPNDQPLTVVLQAATFNQLKVAIRPDPLFAEDGTIRPLEQPPDLPIEQTFCSGSLNPDWLKLQPRDVHLTITGVTPVAQVMHGRLTEEYPTRKHVFSPLVQIPTVGTYLQHTWPFADVLFEPEQLKLDTDKARELAIADVFALRLASHAGLFGKPFSEKPNETSSNHLLRICDELDALINSPGVDESQVQAFFEKGNHRFLLRPDAQEVLPRKTIGGERYKTDFVCFRPDGDYHFIEIENPTKPIYQESGEEQAAHLTHAISQVQDWLRYVEDNRDSVRREDGLETVYKPSGAVIAGRDAHLNLTAKRRFEWTRKQNTAITLRTYDMLLSEVRKVAENMSRFGSCTQ